MRKFAWMWVVAVCGFACVLLMLEASMARGDHHQKLTVVMPRVMWVWIQPHTLHACRASARRIWAPTDRPSYVEVELWGNSKQIQCASDLIEQEQRLNRYDRKVQEYQMIKKRPAGQRP